jgi:predicted acetyltransferase
MTKKYRARSSYTNQTYPARVELTHDVNYTTYQYELLEGSDIYVEYKNSEIIISLCELEFEQQFGSQEIVTLSGRIIYDK